MKKIVLFSLIGILALVIFGCTVNTNVNTDSATTTTIAVTTTTTTTTTTTSTTSTTTSTILQISGTISGYYGDEDTLTLLIQPDFEDDTDPINGGSFSVSDNQVSYVLTLESSGYYYVYTADYNIGGGTPVAGNWIGGYGWTGTGSIETAGNPQATGAAAIGEYSSIEVTNAVTADFTMHQIIAGTPDISGTISGTAFGTLIVLLVNHPYTIGDQAVAASTYDIATSEATKAYDFSSVTNGTYDVVGLLVPGVWDAGGGDFGSAGDKAGIYAHGDWAVIGDPVTFEGTALENIDFELGSTF
ncbi:MAG: hypothetical protein ABIE84_01200 [bacterium]